MMNRRKRIENDLYLIQYGLMKSIAFKTETGKTVYVRYGKGYFTFSDGYEPFAYVPATAINEALDLIEAISIPTAFDGF